MRYMFLQLILVTTFWQAISQMSSSVNLNRQASANQEAVIALLRSRRIFPRPAQAKQSIRARTPVVFRRAFKKLPVALKGKNQPLPTALIVPPTNIPAEMKVLHRGQQAEMSKPRPTHHHYHLIAKANSVKKVSNTVPKPRAHFANVKSRPAAKGEAPLSIVRVWAKLPPEQKSAKKEQREKQTRIDGPESAGSLPNTDGDFLTPKKKKLLLTALLKSLLADVMEAYQPIGLPTLPAAERVIPARADELEPRQPEPVALGPPTLPSDGQEKAGQGAVPNGSMKQSLIGVLQLKSDNPQQPDRRFLVIRLPSVPAKKQEEPALPNIYKSKPKLPEPLAAESEPPLHRDLLQNLLAKISMEKASKLSPPVQSQRAEVIPKHLIGGDGSERPMEEASFRPAKPSSGELLVELPDSLPQNLESAIASELWGTIYPRERVWTLDEILELLPEEITAQLKTFM